MSPISLSTSVAGIDAFFSPPATARIEVAIEASGRTVRRTTSSEANIPISTPAVPSTMLCHFASVSVLANSRDENAAPPVADFAQQLRDALDQASLRTQHLLVDVGYLPLAERYVDDRLGIGIDRGAEVRLRNRHRAHALRGLFGGRWIARQQRRGDPALGLEQGRRDMGIGGLGDGGVELLAQRRQRDDHFGAAVDQRGNPLDPGAVGRQALADAVDHVLLLGGKLQPGFLQHLAEGCGGLPDLDRLGTRIGDEIPRRQPQFVHAAVDVLGEVADTLQPLQLHEGRSRYAG